MTSAETAGADHSLDGFLDRRVTLVQPRHGHRAGLDAALVQALVPAKADGLAVDLGAGVGTIAFCLAARAADLCTVGVERDPVLVGCAGAALALPENAGFASRVRMVRADVTDLPALQEAGLGDRVADWVVMNPPFDTQGRVRGSPDESRRAAHVGGSGTLEAWLRTAAVLLKPNCWLALIHRAAELASALDALRQCRFGDIRVLAVHPEVEKPASRVMVTARLGSRAGLQIVPPLVLHASDGSWTPAADAILRGRAELSV